MKEWLQQFLGQNKEQKYYCKFSEVYNSMEKQQVIEQQEAHVFEEGVAHTDTPTMTPKQLRRMFSYVSHFLSLNSAVDLLPLFQVGQHFTAKEIAESWAMLQAVFNHIRKDTRKGEGKVRVIVVGDGHTARTGALFAYMTKWQVISIDPNFLEEPTKGLRVDRMQTFKSRLEDMEQMTFDEDIIIVMPHAHTSADTALDKFRSKGKRSLVVFPCCNPGTQLPTTNKKPIVYNDEKTLTAKNTIYIYKKI